MSEKLLDTLGVNTAVQGCLTGLGSQENFLRMMALAVLRGAAIVALLSALFVATSVTARAQTQSVLYSFCSQPNCTDGRTPAPDLFLDGQGNLYGVAGGGNSQFYGGVVFEVSPQSGETLVYNFAAIDQGLGPNGGLIRDSSGTFYGTTAGGGNDKGKCKKYAGCGLVYKLTNGNEQVLFDFQGTTDGSAPNGGLVSDQQGNLYGTTYRGGKGNGNAQAGTIFMVSPTGVETLLHRFGSGQGDGRFPNAGLVMDSAGNLYGTTIEGGVDGNFGPGISCQNRCGTVFKLTPAGVETVLHAFKGSQAGDGAAPFSSLILDSKGNLYGTTYAGGKHGQGSVFKITPTGTETVLYSFRGAPDGSFPVGRLVLDSQGNLYGTTSYGGTKDQGTVFELTASKSKSDKRLYSFTGGPDGGSPLDGLVMDAQGNLYGTTFLGGNFNSSCPAGCGVVFKVTP